jgi:hypothetical protein
MSAEHWWNDNCQGKTEVLKENLPQCLSTSKRMYLALGLNSALRGEKSAN